MASYIEDRAYCPDCGRNVLARARSINHVVHILAAVFLCGLWLPIWGLMCVFDAPHWLCNRCGAVCDGPDNPAKPIGYMMLGLTMLAVGFFVVLCLVPPLVR